MRTCVCMCVRVYIHLHIPLCSRTVLQCIYRQVEKAVQHNYYVHGLSHTWTGWYQQQLTQDRLTLSEW